LSLIHEKTLKNICVNDKYKNKIKIITHICFYWYIKNIWQNPQIITQRVGCVKKKTQLVGMTKLFAGLKAMTRARTPVPPLSEQLF
jgi:hypothetical protein